MNSFAFWYEKTKNSTEIMSATVHFNLFCECGWKSPVLDIGLLIDNVEVAQKLKIFLPFEVDDTRKKQHIDDLGSRLQDVRILDALFNDSYIIQKQQLDKYFIAKASFNQNDRFIVYCLDVENDIRLEPFSANDIETGTTIIIDTTHIISATKECKIKKCYLRLRIKNHNLGFLIHKYRIPHTALQNILKTTYMIDFRYNNTRSLSKSLIEEMRDEKSSIAKVNQLHFLLITKAYVNVSETAFSHIRMIEHGVWAGYVADETEDRDTKELVAYHYIDYNKEGTSEKNGMYPSELFTKFQIEKSVIIWYVALTILLGALGSGIVAVIQELLFSSPVHVLAEILTSLQSIQAILERLP